MLGRLARVTVKRRRLVLAASVVALVLAGVFGGGVFANLKTGGFSDPGSQSERAKAILSEKFHAGDPNLVLLVTARQGSADDPAVAQAGTALTQALGTERGIEQAVSYWTLGSPQPLRSTNGRQALVLARIGGDDEQVRDTIKELSPRYTLNGSNGPITVQVGGQAEVFRQVGTQVEEDLRKAETITFPIVLVLLVLVFGSLIAAGLPLAVGVFAVVGTLLVLNVLTLLTNVSIFSINLTTAMGIGLGIDYSLFIVSRFREELRAGLAVDEAVVRSVETAGKTVLFSALTVAIALAALMIFPMYFLRSFAYAGIAVVAMAAAAAIVSLPALLSIIGIRIDRFTLFHRTPKEVGQGFWHRLATSVMRRPIPYAAAVIAVLLVLGAPFLGVKFGQPDDRVLPAAASSRQVQDQIRRNFPSQEAGALEVVAPQAGPSTPDRDRAIDAYAARLSSLNGVSRVDALSGSYAGGQKVAAPNPASARFDNPAGTWLSVVPSVEPNSALGERLAQSVRATPAPFQTLVTGPSAELIDSKAGIAAKLPIAALIIAATTFVVLFLMTGSVVVPLKAIVLNVLSLSATFGAMAWIFQDGHLASFLHFTPTGTLDSTSPVLMFCIAFGLSMDYEVFLLSRIKEEYDQTGDNTHSVAVGLERTGRIVTAAAALLAVVFLAFATSSITFIKMFGIGMALAVIMDATLIRGVLVPAFMRLAGRANWWAPRWMSRIHQRFGISEREERPQMLPLPGQESVLAGEPVTGGDR
jgi:putative drug exporter of the RND superfamily